MMMFQALTLLALLGVTSGFAPQSGSKASSSRNALPVQTETGVLPPVGYFEYVWCGDSLVVIGLPV
jgi:hypothetical protein